MQSIPGVIANENLEGKQFRIVVVAAADYSVKMPSVAGDLVLGVLTNDPGDKESATVVPPGNMVKIKAGVAVTRGYLTLFGKISPAADVGKIAIAKAVSTTAKGIHAYVPKALADEEIGYAFLLGMET